MSFTDILKQAKSVIDNEIVLPTSATRAAVDAMLDDPLVSVHVATMLASAYASTPTNYGAPPGALTRWIMDHREAPKVLSVTASESEGLLDQLNKLSRMTADCNIEGIPIKTAKINFDREITVSESSVITPQQNSRNNVIVNAAPKGRKISVTGYLTTQSSVDCYYINKPTLIAQVSWLDAMATSRRPVWFKDRMNRFFHMQITNFKHEDNPNATNALAVTIDMQEYVVIETDDKYALNIAKVIGNVINKIGGNA